LNSYSAAYAPFNRSSNVPASLVEDVCFFVFLETEHKDGEQTEENKVIWIASLQERHMMNYKKCLFYCTAVSEIRQYFQ